MALIRQAAEYAEAGLTATRNALRAGRSEIAVGAEVEAAVRAAGSDYWSIPTEFSSGPRSAGCHATPRSRMIEPGELAHFEFAGVAARYHATAITTMAVGEPGQRARELHRLNAASLRAGIAAIRPGCPAAAVEEASLEPLRREGLDEFAMMRFGYGIGIGYPPVWLETLQIDRHSAQRIEVGMVFVLHACIELVDEKLGAIQGGTYTLTENGLEMLVGDGDADLVIV
jgi:Xaa-Pro aminopeptidase